MTRDEWKDMEELHLEIVRLKHLALDAWFCATQDRVNPTFYKNTQKKILAIEFKKNHYYKP